MKRDFYPAIPLVGDEHRRCNMHAPHETTQSLPVATGYNIYASLFGWQGRRSISAAAVFTSA